MRDILPTLARWAEDGVPTAVAVLVSYERSAPREPGAAFAVSASGELAGTVTAGCVEPALADEARAVLAGEPPRLLTYGIADEEAFGLGLPCGGTVHVFVDALGADLVRRLSDAVAAERPAALRITVASDDAGAKRVFEGEDAPLRTALDGDVFTLALAPRPALYLVGAGEHAAALATVGRLLGYRVVVVDPRPRFATPERVPDADEVVVEWPDRVLEQARADERTAVCVLSHDPKIDVPALRAALAGPAGYVGAMGSRRTTARRADDLRAEGVADEDIDRIRAPIGVDVGSRTPAEVAVAIGAELVAFTRGRLAVRQAAGI